MELVTARCRLRGLCRADRDQAVSLYTNAEVRRFLGGAVPAEEAARRVEAGLQGGEEVSAVRLRQNGAFIGLVYLSPYDHTDFYELSYQFLPSFWGKGYAFEVLQACLHRCRSLGLERIFAETQEKNARSRRLLEKLGFQQVKSLVRFGERQAVYCIGLTEERGTTL